MASAAPTPLPRRYALTSLGKGTGKYVLYSNDGCQAYVLARYEEQGDLSIEQTGGTSRVIEGTFWRVMRVNPDSGLLTYAGTPGRSEIIGIGSSNDGKEPGLFSPTPLFDAAIEVDHAAMVVVAELLPSRTEAIQVALERYVVRLDRTRDEDRWSVVDTVSKSMPAFAAGRTITHQTTDRAQADADWLNRNHA